MSLPRRFEYLWRNFVRNLDRSEKRLPCANFIVSQFDVTANSSPSRLLTELHFRLCLPTLLPIGKIRVLDIGCGSGRLCNILAELGYSGEYVGLDVQNRFSSEVVPGFMRRLILGDAHEFYEQDSTFDLIVSISALEHIPAESRLIDRLSALLTQQGIEINYVPSGWGLLIYLWHGYRQYPINYISKIFGHKSVSVVALGGFFSFLLHFVVITVGEVLLRLPVRKAAPSFYQFLLRIAIKYDRYLLISPTIFVVIRKKSEFLGSLCKK
jgi:SAM-dependent methyltransferase